MIEDACLALHISGYPIFSVVNDNFTKRWEVTGVAARWQPGIGWMNPDGKEE